MCAFLGGKIGPPGPKREPKSGFWTNFVPGPQCRSLGPKTKKMRAEKPCKTPPPEFQMVPCGASCGQKQFWALVQTFASILLLAVVNHLLSVSCATTWPETESGKPSGALPGNCSSGRIYLQTTPVLAWGLLIHNELRVCHSGSGSQRGAL